VLQEAVARGLARLPPDYYRELGESFARKRERICTTLDEVGLPPLWPQGAYYVLADLSRLPGRTSEERVMHLLHRTKVAAVPGQAFFQDPRQGDGLARFCYAKTDPDLERACEGLRKLG
jgi:aminotransferase